MLFGLSSLQTIEQPPDEGTPWWTGEYDGILQINVDDFFVFYHSSDGLLIYGYETVPQFVKVDTHTAQLVMTG